MSTAPGGVAKVRTGDPPGDLNWLTDPPGPVNETYAWAARAKLDVQHTNAAPTKRTREWMFRRHRGAMGDRAGNPFKSVSLIE